MSHKGYKVIIHNNCSTIPLKCPSIYKYNGAQLSSPKIIRPLTVGMASFNQTGGLCGVLTYDINGDDECCMEYLAIMFSVSYVLYSDYVAIGIFNRLHAKDNLFQVMYNEKNNNDFTRIKINPTTFTMTHVGKRLFVKANVSKGTKTITVNLWELSNDK